MVTSEVAEKIINISFALVIMISSIGWLGFKRSKKSYSILWIGVIPLILLNIFLFFVRINYYSIIFISITCILTIFYVFTLLILYPNFLINNKNNNPTPLQNPTEKL